MWPSSRSSRSRNVVPAAILAALVASLDAGAAQSPIADAVQISASPNRACILNAAGGVKCWGYAPLGDGVAPPFPPTGLASFRYVAAEIPGLSNGVLSIGVGTNHACAVLDSGQIKCWGDNAFGQLGDGTTTTRYAPVDVLNLPGPATAVAPGLFHTCALLASGAVHCWGDNTHGQLGGNALTSGIAAISGDQNHACALTTGGGVKCWGYNYSGQLGDGTTTTRFAPVDVQSLASGVIAITAGGAHNPAASPIVGNDDGSYSCAVMASGGLKCWGARAYGVLGANATGASQLTPLDVAGMTTGVAAISSGGEIYFWPGSGGMYRDGLGVSCAVTTGGGAKCWGAHLAGSLGRGVYGGSSMSPIYPGEEPNPADVVGLTDGVSAIAVGGLWGCAIMTGGAVRCWGSPYMQNGQGNWQAMFQGTVPQTISVPAQSPLAIGATLQLSATGGASGNPVTFTSLTPGTCSVSGSSVTGLAWGICQVAANQAGNVNYDPAPQVTFSFRVGDPLAQTVGFAQPSDIPVQGVVSLNGIATSGLPVSYASNTPSVCSVSGNTVTGLAGGSCTIVASQPGNDLYAPAPQVTRTLSVTLLGGYYGLRVTQGGTGTGTVRSSPAGINCGPGNSICGWNFSIGSTVDLQAIMGPDSYFDRWEGACTGSGTCSVPMTSVRDVTAHFQSSIPRLANISTRAQVLTGDNVLIAGFIIQGSRPKTVVVRVRGPSLAALGVAGVLPDPMLYLYSGNTEISRNGNYVNGPAAQIAALGFAPSSVYEPAILVTLPPGAYTAIVTAETPFSLLGPGVATTGVAIVEVFEVDAVDVPLVNLSTRGMVQTGDSQMIAGFIIQGQGPQTVVVRVRGPSLTQQGVTGVLANPTMQLISQGAVLATNDDWINAPNAVDIQASGFAPLDNAESAVMMALQPGAYTAVVSGVANTTGVAIVEVFRVP